MQYSTIPQCTQTITKQRFFDASKTICFIRYSASHPHTPRGAAGVVEPRKACEGMIRALPGVL